MQKKHQNIGTCVIVLNRQNQILLGRRKNAYGDGLYGIPGGRVEGAEKAIDSAKRELTEETSLTSKKIEYLGVIKDWQDGYTFVHFAYLCTDWAGQVEVVEKDKCQNWDWYDLDKLPEDILRGHQAAIDLLRNKTEENLRDI